MEKILLIDDNKEYCLQVEKTLALRDMEVVFHTNGKLGLESAVSNNWGAILLDVILNQDIDGLYILQKIVESNTQVPIIMISGASTLQTAVEATKKGAYDFLEKPLDVERLLITLRRALEKNTLLKLSDNLRQELGKKLSLIGKSQFIEKTYSDISKIARSDTKVLICGESGVGKDVVAKLLHYHSDRQAKPLITVNCAAIPDNLVETELFGYAKGAFTGAESSTDGFVAHAENGTLFLDEVAELPPPAQAKLLTFLNDGQYSAVGSNEIRKSNVRIIAATNKDLDQEIKVGNFREDLYYRLNVFKIVIPPLRKRIEDIEPLAEFFLRMGCQKFGKTITHFSYDSLELISSQRWQGNARQLKAAVYRMVLFSNNHVIDYGTAAMAIQMDRTNELIQTNGSYVEFLREYEKLYFLNKLNSNNWDLNQVVEESGLELEELKMKLSSLQIEFD